MSVTSPDRRTLMRLALGSAALAVGWNRAAVASEPTGPVEQLHAGLIAIMKAGKTASFRQRYDMIAPVVSRIFDLDTILRQTIGRRWTLLPADQQAALVGSDRLVETRIATASGKVHAMDYLMRQEGGGWKVVDVLAEGSISRVAAQRSEMRSVLADSGGTGLVVSLRQKTAELSGGILQ